MGRNISYRPDIDGLRALAVTAVVIYHAFPAYFPAGFVGVDVFFVISGFLISKILYRELELGQLGLWNFYERRIKRLLPALLLVLATVLVIGWFALLSNEYRILGRHALGGLLFIINFFLANEHGYFDSAVEEKPLLHLWSLAVEEQFYLVWPLMFLMAFRCSIRVWIAVLVIGGMSLSVAAFLSFYSPEYAFFSPFSRAWEFCFGCAIALLERKLKSRAASVLSCIGAVLLLVAFGYISSDLAFVSLWMTLPVLGSAFIIFSGENGWFNKNILAHRYLVSLGLISYPLYLWHWPIFSFLNITEGGYQSFHIRILAIFLSLFLAWFTWRFVERFVRDNWGRTALVLLLTGWLLLVMVSVIVVRYEGVPDRLEPKVNMDSDQLLWEMSLRSSSSCRQDYEIDGLSFCLSEMAGSPNTIAIVGDSFSNQFYYGLSQLFRDDGVGVANLGRHSCAPVFGVQAFRPDKDCAAIEAILEMLVMDESIQVVVLAASWSGTNAYLKDESISSFSSALSETIARLQQSGKKVFLMGSTPLHGLKPSLCAARPFRFSDYSARFCSVSRAEIDARLTSEWELLNSIKSSFPEVVIINPVNYLCDGDLCPIRAPGGLLYRDGHLSKYGSRFLAERIYPHFVGEGRGNYE